MALPSSGELSLNQIQAEFGGPTPPALQNYYRGGANVPNHFDTFNIPESGTIGIFDFYGAAQEMAPLFSGQLGPDAGQATSRTAPQPVTLSFYSLDIIPESITITAQLNTGGTIFTVTNSTQNISLATGQAVVLILSYVGPPGEAAVLGPSVIFQIGNDAIGSATSSYFGPGIN